MFTNTFVDNFAVNSDVEFSVDLLSPRAMTVKAPANINVELKNTVRVRDLDRRQTIYVGYVQDIERDSNSTSVTIAPIMMLLNEVSMQNVFDDIYDQGWAYQIHQQIYNDFWDETPSLYKIPWVYTSGYPMANWGGIKKVGYGAEMKNDMECVISRAKAKGLYMRFALYTSGSNLGRPAYGFYKPSTEFTLEADLENVIERRISETSKEGYNSAIIWYPSDDLGNHGRYSACIIDGQIVYGYDARMTLENPRLIEKVIDHAPTEDERIKLFGSMLQVGSDNVEIELTYKRGDKLITSWSEGRPVKIVTAQKTYNTYCTGYSRKGDLITLKFGTVRQGLTQLLNSEELTK